MIDPDTIRWDPWTPSDLAPHLRGIGKPWYVVGGWALDLWQRKQTRDHEDLEFCILRDDFEAFQRRLLAYPLYAAIQGRLTPLDLTNLSQGKQF